MNEEEFEQIIKPLSLIDNPKHREFIRQVLVGNFNRWHESNFSNTHNEALRQQSVSSLPLPTDEEIKKAAPCCPESDKMDIQAHNWFIAGAKWCRMIMSISNSNNH